MQFEATLIKYRNAPLFYLFLVGIDVTKNFDLGPHGVHSLMTFLSSRLSLFLSSFFVDPHPKMLKRPLNRRNSKRFVIGDEEEEITPPEIEITISENVDIDTDTNENVQSREWLAESSRLKPGTSLT